MFKKIGDPSDVLKIRTLRNKMELAKKTDAKFLLTQFWSFIESHENQINSRDESYFLDSDIFSFGVENNDTETEQDCIKLKELWTIGKIKEKNKDKIWLSFDSLINLAKEYNELI